MKTSQIFVDFLNDFLKNIFIQLTGLGSLEDFGQKTLAELTLSLILKEKMFLFAYS